MNNFVIATLSLIFDYRQVLYIIIPIMLLVGYPTIISDFWQINVGHIIILMGMAASFLWWAIRYDRRISETVAGLHTLKDETLKAFVEIHKNISDLSSRIMQMDQVGTRASALALRGEQTQIESNTRRIEILEATMRDIAPKITKIEADVEWLVHVFRKGEASPIS